MPIVFVSVDSKNATLDEFKSLEKPIQILFISEDPAAFELSNQVGKYNNRLKTEALNPRGDGETDDDVRVRFQSVLNVIRGMEVETAMIISHHTVFNTWKEGSIVDEWDIIGM
jgi:broad specificity phosphatase PhoE